MTEGVAAGHDGMIYFSDITFTKFCKDPSGKYLQAGNIWKYNPKTGETTIFRSPTGMSNGIKFDRDGNMIAALGADYGGRMLIKTDMKTGKSYILAGLYEGGRTTRSTTSPSTRRAASISAIRAISATSRSSRTVSRSIASTPMAR